MVYMRCKCGYHESYGSGCIPQCVGCHKCNTTLSTSPDGHKTPKDHEYITKYNENDGTPYEICINCMTIKKEV